MKLKAGESSNGQYILDDETQEKTLSLYNEFVEGMNTEPLIEFKRNERDVGMEQFLLKEYPTAEWRAHIKELNSRPKTKPHSRKAREEKETTSGSSSLVNIVPPPVIPVAKAKHVVKKPSAPPSPAIKSSSALAHAIASEAIEDMPKQEKYVRLFDCSVIDYQPVVLVDDAPPSSSMGGNVLHSENTFDFFLTNNNGFNYG